MMGKTPDTPKLGLREGPIRTAGITPAPAMRTPDAPGTAD
jgi:cytochrome d ubiquinol oxidase subunit I